MSAIVVKKTGGVPKENRPRFAWWRNLHCQANWEGDGSNTTFVHLPAVKRNASTHLKWAKQVHTQQKEWLDNHCQLCKPLPRRAAPPRLKTAPGADETMGDLPKLFGTVFKWAAALRVDSQEVSAKWAEERRELQQRRASGLQRLRKTQQKWRRDQRAWKRKQLQAMPQDTGAESGSQEAFRYPRLPQSLETVESEDETSSNASQRSSDESSQSDHFGPIDRPSASESANSSSSAEGQPDFTERVGAPLVQTSLLRRNSVQRQGLLTQPVIGATAKDAEGGDLNLEELFDAGNDGTHDANESTLAALTGDYLASTLLSRNSSRRGSGAREGRRHSFVPPPDALPSELREEFAIGVRQQCETWRSEFPLEVLDQLATAYDTWSAEEDGQRKTSVRNLSSVLRYVLGWPPKVLQQVLQDSGQEELHFKKLSDLLELISRALRLAEMEEPDVLWSDWDLNLVKESFRKFTSQTSTTMPVVNLFQAIRVLGFEELEMDSPDRQRWLAGITKEVLARKAASSSVETSRRESWAPASGSRAGTGAQLSFRDFLRIASRALRETERESRVDQCRAEIKAAKAGHYSLLELEDMRELHSSFCSLKASMRSFGGKGNLDAMQELLTRCGVPPLDATDVGRLRTILRPQKERKDSKAQIPAGMEEVSFVLFLRWMREIREVGIEGLAALHIRRGDEVSLHDLESRRGFHSAMLKEQFYVMWETSQWRDDVSFDSFDGLRIRGESDMSKMTVMSRMSLASNLGQDRRPP